MITSKNLVMSDEKGMFTARMHRDELKIRKAIRDFKATACGDARAQDRVKAINTLLNSGYDLRVLDEKDLVSIWELIFFGIWYSEMGRGCEEIIAAVERACRKSLRLTIVGFNTIAQKWYGLDQYRVDKVSHLARHLLNVLMEQQMILWLNNYKKSKKLGTGHINCKQVLARVFNDIANSYGLCYFLLEIYSDEFSNSLVTVYDKFDLITGKFEVKAKLIIFCYKQVIKLATNLKLDSRLLQVFDLYVMKKFVKQVLSNESQLTQILVSLRFYENLERCIKRAKNPPSKKCKALLSRWSIILQDVHNNCINAEYFPICAAPTLDTIDLKPCEKD